MAAMGAADPRRGTTMATDRDDADFEPPHTSSPTDHVLSELQLYGYRPFHDEPDPRPLPQANAVSGAVADIFARRLRSASSRKAVRSWLTVAMPPKPRRLQGRLTRRASALLCT